MTIVSRRREVILISLGICVVLTVTFFNSFYETTLSSDALNGDGSFLHPGHQIIVADRLPKAAVEVGKTQKKSIRVNLEQEFSTRNRHLQLECNKTRNAKQPYEHLYSKQYLSNIMINEQKHLIYCYVPKVANTNFRRVFLALEGILPKSKISETDGYDIYFIHANNFKFLSQYDVVSQQRILNEYNKFMFVRDPLTKLLSAYRNKFFHPNPIHRLEYIGNMKSFYSRHSTLVRPSLMRTDFDKKPLTFTEFLYYWTDVFENEDTINEHFVPTSLLCRPCDIKYDFLGKYETLNDDVRYIFNKLDIDIEFPGRNDNYSSVETNSLLEDYYKDVPKHVMKKVWTILQLDFSLFGYELPEWLTEKLS